MTMKTESYKVLENKKILILGMDDKVNNVLQSSIKEHVKKTTLLKRVPDYLDLSQVDLIIIDTEYYDIEDLIHTFSNDFYNTPIIFLVPDLNSVSFEDINSISVKNILLKDQALNNIFIYIYIILQKRDKIIFKDGYLYSLRDNRFYYKKVEVPLTKLELKLFKYLIKNINRVIDYEEIRSNVWDNKSCTIYSVRNVINKIREKSYYEIISNISKQGYTINNDYIYI